jgi:hypothetical protein
VVILVTGNRGVETSMAAGGGNMGWLTAVKPCGAGLSLETKDSGDWLLLSAEIGASGGEAAAFSRAFAAASIFNILGVADECERNDTFESDVPGRDVGAVVLMPNLLLRGVRGSSNLMPRAILELSDS